MSEYYHEFAVGFNLWYVLVPLVIVAFAIIGYFSVTEKRNKQKLWEVSQKNFLWLTVIGTVAMTILFTVESNAGIIQWLDNHSDGTSDPIYSLFGCIFVIAIFAVLLFKVSKTVMDVCACIHRESALEHANAANERLSRSREEKARADAEYRIRLQELEEILEEINTEK